MWCSGKARVDAGVRLLLLHGRLGQGCSGIQEPNVPTPGIPLCQWTLLAAREEEGWKLRPAIERGSCWHAGRACYAVASSYRYAGKNQYLAVQEGSGKPLLIAVCPICSLPQS